MIKKLYLKYQEIINYLIFGVLTTIVSLGSYYLLTTFIFDPSDALELQITNILSWIFAVTFAYVTNRKYVFNSKDKHVFKEMAKFYIARLASLFIDMLLMYIFVSRLKFNDKIIKIIVQVIVVVINYIFSKLLIFKKQRVKE